MNKRIFFIYWYCSTFNYPRARPEKVSVNNETQWTKPTRNVYMDERPYGHVCVSLIARSSLYKVNSLQ